MAQSTPHHSPADRRIVPRVDRIFSTSGDPLTTDHVNFGANSSSAGTPFIVREPLPSAQSLPFVVTVPHAGIEFFDTLRSTLHPDVSLLDVLQRGDVFTDFISGHGHAFGATHIISTAAPSFLNVGRSHTSIKPDDVRGGISTLEHNPDDPYIDAGQGLVSTRTLYGNAPIYAEGQEPDEAEIQARLEAYYWPFHERIEEEHNANLDAHGYSLNFDIHSMPSIGAPKDQDAGQARPDLVFSNNGGASCSPELFEIIAETAREFDLTVEFNYPYRGGFLTQKYARNPGEHYQHFDFGRRGAESLQVEYNRQSLGIDEETLRIVDPDKFEHMQRFTGHLIEKMSGYVMRQCAP